MSLEWGTRQLYASDESIILNWSTAGTADFQANTITTTGTGTFGNILPATDNTYYLGQIGSPYKAWKALILKDTINGKHYKIEMVNGVLTSTALD